ncbi:23S rRNA (pseudouridine(1915)-N(3))-methyltransferase RlmH [Agriterribacter sp.]|uniref:23S rRNA (pseudouridine(1915)-N(3))-methyltransferase RlmH n=1 Tax=Agriterribacter sp. TaxID=2821509 RepID=UPI002C0239A8|nr:23S rRNA (pseudouridine(1915)-N(3))-methyltransferase RlmH [Agriterribacter sp.]HTN09005.1 23S rRNA (pseudouridine(1915)-N(3))-methyltransferase RlmH [Agriterribacter sp.]
MKIILCSIGKEDDVSLKAGILDFSKRISHYYPVEWKIISPSKKNNPLSGDALKIKESSQILETLKKDDYLIALDGKGKLIDSKKLSIIIQTRANESVKQLVFLIGGAYGLDESVIKRANFVWSLSPLTFPHQLVRLILSEQVYRACTIIKNEKYHHA